jgi:hypothetical protein
MIGGAEEVATTREAARWLLDNAEAEEARPLRAKRRQKN